MRVRRDGMNTVGTILQYTILGIWLSMTLYVFGHIIKRVVCNKGNDYEC